jgi:hypothetical protein
MPGQPCTRQKRAVEVRQLIHGDRVTRRDTLDRGRHGLDVGQHLDGRYVKRLFPEFLGSLCAEEPPGADL